MKKKIQKRMEDLNKALEIVQQKFGEKQKEIQVLRVKNIELKAALAENEFLLK